MRGNRSQTYSFWSDSEPKPISKRNTKKSKSDVAVAAKKSDSLEIAQVIEQDKAKPSCSADDDCILLKSCASIEDLTKDIQYRDVPGHVILDYLAKPTEDRSISNFVQKTLPSSEIIPVIQEMIIESDENELALNFPESTIIHEQLFESDENESFDELESQAMAFAIKYAEIYNYQDAVLLNDLKFSFKYIEINDLDNDGSVQDSNTKEVDCEIAGKKKNQFCEFHGDDFGCHLRKSDDSYCSYHSLLLTSGTTVIFDNKQELLFRPRHGCAVAEPRIHAYDPCTLNLNKSTLGDMLRNMKEIANAALETVSAKEMWLRVRKDDYFRTRKAGFRTKTSGSKQKKEPITNLDSVEAVLSLERMRSFNHNLETNSLAFIKEDDFPNPAEIDFLDVWDNIDIEEDREQLCDCGRILKDEEYCKCKEDEDHDADQFVDIEADDSVVYRYLNEAFQEMPAETYEKTIYPPIPWASIMRGSVDGEIYECFEDTSLPTTAKELIICALENCLFVKKVFPNGFKYKVKCESKEDVNSVKPKTTFNIEALSSEFVLLSTCFEHHKSFNYPLIWRITPKYDIMIGSLKVTTDKINWAKIDKIGVLRNVYTEEMWKRHEDEKARIAEELKRNPPPKPSFFADIIANRTYYYKPPAPTILPPQASRKRKVPTITYRIPPVRQTLPSTPVFRPYRPTSTLLQQIPRSNQTYAQIPVSNQIYSQVPTSNQTFIQIPSSNHTFVDIPTSNQTFIEIPTSNQTFTQVSNSNETFIEIPSSNQTFVPTTNYHDQYSYPDPAVEDVELMEVDPTMPHLERMTYNQSVPPVNHKPMSYYASNPTYYMSVPTSTVAFQENDPMYTEDYIYNGYCNGNG